MTILSEKLKFFICVEIILLDYICYTRKTSEMASQDNEMDLSKEEIAAAMAVRRRERYVDGYYCEEHLLEVLMLIEYFGSCAELHKDGLKIHFERLKNEVTKSNLIGLIICGAYYLKDTHLHTYTTVTNNKIEITTKSICERLLNDYFTKEEIDEYCRKTPNFHTYYNQ